MWSVENARIKLEFFEICESEIDRLVIKWGRTEGKGSPSR